jgi:predicted ATPase
MIKKIRLRGFKNFKDAELKLGPFTVLVGTNAAGKSNIREAFRFLHAISRGYTLPEIIGEKWGEGGYLQWRGINGGSREIFYHEDIGCLLEVDFVLNYSGTIKNLKYGIELLRRFELDPPILTREYLYQNDNLIFDTQPNHNHPNQIDPHIQKALIKLNNDPRLEFTEGFFSDRPILSQLLPGVGGYGTLLEWLAYQKPGLDSNSYDEFIGFSTVQLLNELDKELRHMQFLDLQPDAMRQPSFPGQIVLGDRGENLSSVLQNLYKDEQKRNALIEWIGELTPMDVTDFSFYNDLTGKILASLKESNGHQTSLYSASDGTLRFLGLLTAMFGTEPPYFFFIEELENGIHPTRLHLLIQLIESFVNKRTSQKDGAIQVIATTHSPQLLRLLSKESLENANLVYRFPDRPEGHVKRILDIPEARKVIEEQDVARLYESGWLEDAVAFTDEEALVP